MQARVPDGLLLPKDPYMPRGGLDQLLRRTGEQKASMVHHNQLAAYRLHVLNDMRTEQHQAVLGLLGEEVPKVNALLRVQAHRGFVKQ